MTATILNFPTKPEITASPANRRKLIERARFSISARDKTKVLMDGGWIRCENEYGVMFVNCDVSKASAYYLDDAFEIEMLRGLARMGILA